MKEKLPKTLLEAVKYFADEQTCFDFVASLRWENGVPLCPHCRSEKVGFLSTRKIWKCKNKECRKQFSIKTDTIFEDSALKLDKWLIAMWLIATAKNGISSYELSRSLGITQKSAWFVLHRIRLAMEQGSFGQLSGTVECDETYIGGDAKWMHREKRDRVQMKGGRKGLKVSVLGMLERKGKVRAKVVPSRKRKDLIPVINENVELGSEVFTDEHVPYMMFLPQDYIHDAVNHAREYVRGNVHTNAIENFWSLLKRTIKGTYVSIQAEHLQKYVEEQCFRHNNRETDDQGRFLELVKSVGNKGITYKELIGYQTSH
jgi:transposase-like protein